MLGTRPLGPGRRCPPTLIHPASQQGGGGEVDKHGRWSQGGVGGARNQFNFLIRLMCSKSGGKLGGPARSGQWVVKGARSPGSQSAARWFINIRASWGRGRPSSMPSSSPGGSSTSEPAGGGGDHHQCLLHHQGGRGWRCLCFKASLTQA